MKNRHPMYQMILLFVWLLFSQNAFTQQNIIGEVKQAYAVPVPYASILLLNPYDGSIVMQQAADEDGYFVLSNIYAGSYLMKIRANGFQTEISKLIYIKNQVGSYSVGPIVLQGSLERTAVRQDNTTVGQRKLISNKGNETELSPISYWMDLFINNNWTGRIDNPANNNFLYEGYYNIAEKISHLKALINRDLIHSKQSQEITY